ncbi:uncharacterized protein PV06_00859 [Exophiala oligosperma]|uniref:Heterokaryon incompatibility domain-containing protein n=1 Tax=Exophiala oligosperma TaxID=215243 RepID=A0A0D2DYT6_9EURO|nr:uncharacterized protein PV06_00859 [Exophiala oligosperma]KIW48253.1 hypothetical protein PV06_00859 [Exophiala oligosperma]
MSTSGHFQHSRLSLSGKFMRLLQIQGSTTASISSNTSSSVSSKREAPISLRITQYALHRRPPYVAISYTWGNAVRTHEIRVNGRPFLVRANLYNLLWHLRQRGESRFLWIDALCIDQANLEERNFHVQLMGSIYDSADRTIVWLGLPSEDRRQARALEFVAELASAMSPTSTSHPGGNKIERRSHAANQDNWERLYITGRGSGNAASANVNTSATSTIAKLEGRWRNLLDLCRGVYWTRTWIIQEFLRSPSLEVLVGTASLDWKLFEVVVGTLKSTSLLWSPTATTTTIITTLVDQFMHTLPVRLTLRRTHHSHSTLSDLVAEFYDSRCAERRDKIYGILGIADDCDDTRGPQPDYSKHIVEVYFEVYRYLCACLEATTSPSAYQKVLFAQTISLTIRALNITQADVESYLSATSLTSTSTANDDDDGKATANTTLESLVFNLRPDYVNTIDEVLPGWTSIRDLRQRLDQVPWEKYVGHEVVRRKTSRHPSTSNTSTSTSTPLLTPTSTPTQTTQPSSNAGSTTSNTTTPPSSAKGTEYVRAPLPPDLLTTIIAAASTTHNVALANLYNYETCRTRQTQPTMKPTCRIPHETILSHEQDKRLADNTKLAKPSVIIESNPNPGSAAAGGNISDPFLRLGFACTNVKRGDLICQFRGVDVAVVARRVSTGGGLSLVGLARMVGHSALRERGVHAGCETTAQQASQSQSQQQSRSAKGKDNDNDKNKDKSWWWSGIVLPPGVDEKNVHTNTNTHNRTHDHHDYIIETDPLSLWELFRPRYE